MTRQIVLLLLGLCWATTLQAKDYSLIKLLPYRLSDAQKQAHKGWDTGNTGTMREATSRYNNTLAMMMKDVVDTYYSKDSLHADRIDDYIKALYTVHRFKHDAENPRGGFQGTMTFLDVPAAVSAELESAIPEMVQAIVADDSTFDYKHWKKSWQQARGH